MIKIQHQGCFSQAVSGEGKEYAFATVAEEFQNPNSAMFCSSVPLWSVLLITLAILSECSVAAAVAPLSDCYSLDKENYLFDFVSFLPVFVWKV